MSWFALFMGVAVGLLILDFWNENKDELKRVEE